jgi:hypothetical protein
MSNAILSSEWIQHPVYKDYYFSRYGFAASLKNGKFRILKGTTCGQYGYKAICVVGKKKIYIHRTVCELFNGLSLPGQECRHLDGNNQNNDASNLQWGTASENARDKILHGTNGAGEKNSMAKLTRKQVEEMRRMKSTHLLTYKEIANKFDVSRITAWRAINKETWK